MTKGQIIEGDLLNASSLSRFLEPGSVVFNLAYLSNRSGKDNLQAARNLAEVCFKAGIHRLIHVSTAGVVCRCHRSCFPASSRLAGRYDMNPRRVYRCNRVLHAGFRKPVPFKDGVGRFAEWFKSGEHAAARNRLVDS